MTDLRRSVDTTTRFHQKQQQSVTHDSYRSSCNSSPEPKSSLALCQSLSNGSYRHPLLQNLTDHPNMNSTSGGSSSTSTTATATTIGRSSQYISENGNHNSSMGEIQFDEREIYYVSPSKRKSSLSGGSQQNNVTFSNHIIEQRVITSQNRGSLRRSKGRSNQSLCSCDAGSDAELNPDPARPLYEYSLERRRKVHTYTCEQNAQILLRLERERNRKLSLSGGSSSAAAIAIGSSSKDDLEESHQAYGDLNDSDGAATKACDCVAVLEESSNPQADGPQMS
ncbi:uncharacterized protein [Musca autumnalis]|uniref:uncharacterized protein n=1 Tax=Musca autumnalis TaxID=221902 RepID=UPI003CEF25BB